MPSHTPTTATALLSAVALVVASVAFFPEVGVLGLAVAAVGVGVALVTTGVTGVALLHLGALAVGGELGVVGLVLLETASAFVLVGDAPAGQRLETGALFVPVAVGLAVAVTLVAEGNGLPAGALALVVAVAVGTYVLHRYAHVRLGLANGDLDT